VPCLPPAGYVKPAWGLFSGWPRAGDDRRQAPRSRAPAGGKACALPQHVLRDLLSGRRSGSFRRGRTRRCRDRRVRQFRVESKPSCSKMLPMTSAGLPAGLARLPHGHPTRRHVSALKPRRRAHGEHRTPVPRPPFRAPPTARGRPAELPPHHTIVLSRSPRPKGLQQRGNPWSSCGSRCRMIWKCCLCVSQPFELIVMYGTPRSTSLRATRQDWPNVFLPYRSRISSPSWRGRTPCQIRPGSVRSLVFRLDERVERRVAVDALPSVFRARAGPAGCAGAPP